MSTAEEGRGQRRRRRKKKKMWRRLVARAALCRLIFMLTDKVAKGRADGCELTRRGRTLWARTNSDVISAALQGRTRLQGIPVLNIDIFREREWRDPAFAFGGLAQI